MHNENVEAHNSDLEFLSKILDIPYVKKAFDHLVYHKLLVDGYIYCKEGLVPSNKNVFKVLEKINSPLYNVIKEKNPENYEGLYKKMEEQEVPAEYGLSVLEEKLIIYAIFQVNSSPAAEVLTMLHHYYNPDIKYSQFGEFVCSEDIELTEIDNLQSFIACVSKLLDTGNLFYRGHSNLNYIAVPSIFREERFYRNEYKMYQELVIRCASSFLNCSSHLDFLMEMQHYGLPTRLLDVTANPLVALYFACENTKNSGEVIVYDINSTEMKYEKCDEVAILTALPMYEYSRQRELLSDITYNNGLLHSATYNDFVCEIKCERPMLSNDIKYSQLTNPVFVKPARRNSRILRQEGAFIIWGLDDIYYGDGMYEQGKDNGYRYRQENSKVVFYIPSKKKQGILDSLNRVGINKAFVYPEIDDVATFIKDTVK